MEGIFKEISDERDRHVAKGYDANFDDGQGLTTFCDAIVAYSTWAKQMINMESPKEYRKRMMQVAALAIAACESYDRKDKRTFIDYVYMTDASGKASVHEIETKIPLR
jgi:hypothetical protein